MTRKATKMAAAMSLALLMFIGANCFAVTPYFSAAGSSGAFNSFALAAGPAVGGAVCGGFIWTKKSGAQGVDNRGTGLLETGNSDVHLLIDGLVIGHLLGRGIFRI